MCVASFSPPTAAAATSRLDIAPAQAPEEDVARPLIRRRRIDFLKEEEAVARLDPAVVPTGTPPPAQVRFCYVGDLLWRCARWVIVEDEPAGWSSQPRRRRRRYSGAKRMRRCAEAEGL
jgi:hypothetical protein